MHYFVRRDVGRVYEAASHLLLFLLLLPLIIFRFVFIFLFATIRRKPKKFVRERGLRGDRPAASARWCTRIIPPARSLARSLTYLPSKCIVTLHTYASRVHSYSYARNARVRNSNNSSMPARPIPGGRQLPDGKTPALPFLVDRSVDPFREEFTAVAACLFLLLALC